MLKKSEKSHLYRFDTYKLTTQFLQYMCVKNGFAWLLYADFNC